MASLDQESLAEMIEDGIGTRPRQLTRIAEGMIQETYGFHVGDDALVVQYLPAASRWADNLAVGARTYQELQETDLPVPEVTCGPRTYESDGTRFVYYIAERLPGDPLKDGGDASLTRRAIHVLSEIHRSRRYDVPGVMVSGDGHLTVEPFEAGGWQAMVRHKMEENTEILREEGASGLAERLTGFVRDGLDRIPDDIEPVLCHNDYSPGNILVQDGQVTGVLDFDFALAGHAERDLVKAVNSFWLEMEIDRQELYRSYAVAGHLPAGFDRREPIYRVTTLLEIVASSFDLLPGGEDEPSWNPLDVMAQTVEGAAGDMSADASRR